MAIRHTIRHKDYIPTDPKTRTVTITRGKAIRLFCCECMGHQAYEVKNCPDKLCPLFPYKMGREEKPSETP